MPQHILLPPFSFIINKFLFLSLFLSFLIPIYTAENYKSCAPFSCGNFTNISYPFWSGNQPNFCGHPKFKLDCQHGNLTIDISSQKFHIIDINKASQLLKIARFDLWSYDAANIYSCPNINVSLDLDFFNYTLNDEKYTLFYECDPLPTDSYSSSPSPLSSEVSQELSCLIEGKPYDAYLVSNTKSADFVVLECKNNITIPSLKSSFKKDSDIAVNVLKEGFEVKWSGVNEDICNYCIKYGGRCGYNTSQNVIMCLCPNQQQSYSDCGFCRQKSTSDIWPDVTGCKRPLAAPPVATPSSGYGQTPSRALVPSYGSNSKESHNVLREWKWKGKLIAGSVGAAFVGLSICITVFCFKYKSTKNNLNIEEFFKNHEAFTIRRYKFSHIKEMTNNFKVKLGQGGYGSVYKGKLLNDSPVAVKILNASRGNGEEFINEVSSITKTSHVNVVALLGFCFEGRKKALIYELMSNGSLDKYIHNNNPESIPSLSWEILYEIAKGIARGLEYLHRGCSTRILHFDIKPHNILLDENFCPKISDFGLARLCPKKQSIISISDARGTMGYVAPEMWNRNFGGVSHKSDVYSYGMMLLEMVGGRKNVNAEASQTSEIYFPHWVYKRLDLGTDLRPNEVIAIEEDGVVRRMTIVGLWCIQTFPNDRPKMSRVIEMLEGNISSLEIPPKPMLSSPTRSRSIQDSSTS